MNIFFLENRDKTFFWEAVAKKLDFSGHKINWIVQNHSFKPNFGKVHLIPYPKNSSTLINPENINEFKFIETTDRMVNYFNTDNIVHYQYYYNFIEKIFKQNVPDVVFGESTQFHELLTILFCDKNNIKYFHPSSSSYPPGRFFFYKGNSKYPFQINDYKRPIEYRRIIEKISMRKLTPDYMKKIKSKTIDLKKVFYRINQIREYYKGEKLTTPSLFKKLNKDSNLKNNKKKWDKLSLKIEDIQNRKCYKLLYPLQMQPEANIDVWGNRFRNQTSLIEHVSRYLPDNWNLVVKLNPKTKYELNEELISLLINKKNIIPIHSSENMDIVFNNIDMVLTNTGTIAIECILSNKPLIQIGPGITKSLKETIYISEISAISDVLKNFKNGEKLTASFETKKELIDILLNQSFEGIISDPFNDPKCMDDKNIDLVSNGFESILVNINE